MNNKAMANTGSDLITWSKILGLFPMPLFQEKHTKEKFILLNGGAAGNFCLDYREEDIELVRNYAWSSNVGHYLTVNDNNVSVYRWDTSRVERFTRKSVENRLDNFYSFLKEQPVNNQESIIRFGIQFYRQFRSLLRDDGGNDSLNVLLYFLACVAEGNIDRANLQIENWAIGSNAKSIALQITSSHWERLYEMLITGLRSKDLRPNINLLLRHASGSLFQEAHFEAIFPASFQQSFDGFLPKIERFDSKNPNQSSAHFTPTSIVRTIVEESIKRFSFANKKEITVLDPACGSGEFLKEFIRQVRLKGYKGKVKLVGWDVSNIAIDMARFIVSYEIRPYSECVSIDIKVKNSLEDDWKIETDILLMNPPFISWELMNAEEKNLVSRILGDLKSKRPNTASAFLINAVKSLRVGGVIGCILPTSTFEADSGIPLREEIRQLIDVQLIGRLGSHSLFSGALVDAGILIGSVNKVKSQTPLILWSDYRLESGATALRQLRKLDSEANLKYASGDGYSLYTSEHLVGDKFWRPIPLSSFEILERLSSFPKVADIFEVKQGARTGMNSVFVISKEFYLSLAAKEKKFFRPAVTNDSIKSGSLNDSYYIFFPNTEGIKIETESELATRVPTFYRKYLKPNYQRLSKRKGVGKWWELTRPRNWQKSYKSKLLSTEFGKSGSFAYDRDGSFVAERSHAWFARHEKNLGDIGFAYVTVLSMPIIDNLLAGLSKQIGGGQWYLSSKFINEMPLPNLFDSNQIAGLTQDLIDVGMQISSGYKVDREQLVKFSKILYSYS